MKTLLATAFALTALGTVFAQPASAATAPFKVEHNFCAKTDCVDGAEPFTAPVADANGNYYGTLSSGGAQAQGAIYQATLTSGVWHVLNIHSFCAQAACADGARPNGGLIVDVNGNLYGMATQGGSHTGGLIYELSHATGKWVYHVIHNFCAEANCADGSAPMYASLAYQGQASGALYDGTSPLYGTTSMGGGFGAGIVFSLTHKTNEWSAKTLYSFCSLTGCTDGGQPFTGVTLDAMGNLFGAVPLAGVQSGSDTCCGLVYELTPHGTGDYRFTALHSFCSKIVNDICDDGRAPLSLPILDADGTLYGTTFGGGVHDFGTAYKLVPDGVHSKLTVLHNFCAKLNCTDGALPHVGSLTMDASGALYGTTLSGGPVDGGLVYKLAGKNLNTFSLVLLFKGPNGGGAAGGLTLDPSGAFFGVTTGGGKNEQGVFYRLDP